MKIKKLLKVIFPEDDIFVDDALERTTLLRDCLRVIDVNDPSTVLYRNRLEEVTTLLDAMDRPVSKAKPKSTKPIEVSTQPGPHLLADGDIGSPLT